MTLRDYHTWPFMLWMEKTLGEGTIRTTYQGFEQARSVPAIDKRDALRKLIEKEDVKNAIIFCNRKRDVDILYKSLKKSARSKGKKAA